LTFVAPQLINFDVKIAGLAAESHLSIHALKKITYLATFDNWLRLLASDWAVGSVVKVVLGRGYRVHFLALSRNEHSLEGRLGWLCLC